MFREIISFGARKENGIWIHNKNRWKIMLRGHDSLFVAAGRFRMRLMKLVGPYKAIKQQRAKNPSNQHYERLKK